MVDLAESESLKESNATGDRLTEKNHIKSLSNLGNVIMALSANESHVPFLNCKLTFLLQQAFGGNAKTLMLVHVSPKEACTNETINSLRCQSERQPHWHCHQEHRLNWLRVLPSRTNGLDIEYINGCFSSCRLCRLLHFQLHFFFFCAVRFPSFFRCISVMWCEVMWLCQIGYFKLLYSSYVFRISKIWFLILFVWFSFKCICICFSFAFFSFIWILYFAIIYVV